MEYKIENKDMIKELFKEKLNRLENNINLIVSMINERNEVQNKALKDIDQQAMNTRSEILGIENFFGYNGSNLSPLVHELEKRITDLEVTKVKEQINTWRDVVMLKQNLMAQVNEMEMAKTRINLFQEIKK